MGEEEKKAGKEEKKADEEQKTAESEDKKPEDNNPDKEKKSEEEERDSSKELNKEEEKKPQEIILKVYMHCEGCARKVQKCLRGFEGVEDVTTDCRSGKVVVKGEKADPMRVLERVQRKSHRRVQLVSPVPKPPEEKPPAKEEEPKPEEKKEEPPVVVTVVLRVHMHCEACSVEIRKRIRRMKGVESAESDLKSSQVTVKGVFDPPKLVDYVYKRTGKHAVVVSQNPPPAEAVASEPSKAEKKEEKEMSKALKGEEKADGETDKKEDQGEKDNGDNNNNRGEEGGTVTEESDKAVELKRNEYNYYYPSYFQFYPQAPAMEMHSYPQIFSDENPNACSVM